MPPKEAPPARARRDRPDRSRRLRIRLSARTLGRHAPARGLCARARRRSDDPAARRAVLGARRADGRNAAHRHPRSVDRAQLPTKCIMHRHAQYRGSGRSCADRILIFGSNPGTHRAEIPIPFPHPRNVSTRPSASWSTRSMRCMTTRARARRRRKAHAAGYQLGSPLPDVSTNEIAGLFETLSRAPFRAKPICRISQRTHMGDEELFPIIEVRAAPGLRRARRRRHRADAVPRTFAEADLMRKKNLCRSTSARSVPLVAHIKRVLDERPGHRAPGRASKKSSKII